MKISIYKSMLTLFIGIAGALSCSDGYAQSGTLGFTEPIQRVEVSALEPGVITSIPVQDGAIVKQGDVLCQLDSSILQADLETALARLNATGKLAAAKATQRHKQNMFNQIEMLFVKEHASEQEVKQARLELELANANLQTVKDEIALLQCEVRKIETQLKRRTIRSPIDGIIVESFRKTGESTHHPDGRRLFIVVNLSQLKVRYYLPTSVASKLQVKQKLELTFVETKQSSTAEVSFISPITDSESGTVVVELSIENAAGNLRSGVACQLIGLGPNTGDIAQCRTDQKPR